MKRDYTSGTEISDVQYFVGTEIEYTPAFGKWTLFVSGVHSPEQVLELAKEHAVDHIYFGANQSFKTQGADDYETWNQWEKMIMPALQAQYWCTLDLDISELEGLHEAGMVDHHLFIPQISVKLPYIKQLNYNACLKLDDIDFNRTNPGVWVHSVHDLMERSRFTNWREYRNDTVIK